MTNEQLIGVIKHELPALLRSDPSLRQYIIELAREESAPRQQTEDRFDRMFAELARNREEWQEYVRTQHAKSQEQESKWEEYTKKQDAKWEAQERKWEENRKEWREYLEAQDAKWEAQERKWEENQKALTRSQDENRAMNSRVERHLGAMGARWGLQSEAAFRNALAAILEETFGVEVLNINDYDETGEVFGRPDQIELDVIIKNGMLLICELKSSIDKAGMYIFERKARFYEKRHNRKANRLIVISPMADAKAAKVAKKLGIEVYGDALDVEEEGYTE